MKKKITIVVPAYNESENILPLLDEINAVVINENKYDWIVQFVDDCSTDNTWEVISSLEKYDGISIKAIRFSSNFGKEPALVAGLTSSVDSDAIIFMDADLQHPPKLIPQFLRKWEAGYKNISGIRSSADDYTWFKRVSSNLFYSVMNFFGDIELPRGLTDFKLIDKNIAKEFLKFKEKTVMFRGLIEWLGFKKCYIEFVAPARLNGEAAYSFRKLSTLALNSFTSFSLLPLKIAGTLGALILIGCSLLVAYMLITEAIGTQVFTPLAYFVVFNTFLTGTVLSSIGFIAVYIGRIHVQVVDRPLYVISDEVEK
ncbi:MULTISPECIES: glycosyltransferase family 2 protein [Marinomonas]|uniref:Glycosyltransferase family 2 protein n=1 Tax=Marinomonas rhodophyticola TaxID=2992803 RepID=A0ABT3KKD0_9GAMM|nr:glycosyltransferase family 2 protein [Marinomonas sp. KJ51-3]MCW4631030.1 glycosyltransferase family 2 protein [Marinomonas sp. KJ51-3]